MSKPGDNKGVTTRAGASAAADAARQNNITNKGLDYHTVFNEGYETHSVSDKREAAVLTTWKDTKKQEGIGHK